jgi:hypothetical protein
MIDIRVIKIVEEEDGSLLVEFTEDLIDEPISGRDAAIQRFMIALYTTPGSMIDASSWGAGAMRLVLSKRSSNMAETTVKVSEVVDRAIDSLLPNEEGEFAIEGAVVDKVERLSGRGLRVSVTLRFQNGLTSQISVAGAISVTQ